MQVPQIPFRPGDQKPNCHRFGWYSRTYQRYRSFEETISGISFFRAKSYFVDRAGGGQNNSATSSSRTLPNFCPLQDWQEEERHLPAVTVWKRNTEIAPFPKILVFLPTERWQLLCCALPDSGIRLMIKKSGSLFLGNKPTRLLFEL